MIIVFQINEIQFISIEMQSGTLLHLALLRKISNLSSLPNYREKFNEYRKKKTISQCQNLPSFVSSENRRPALPLVQVNLNRDKTRTASNNFSDKKTLRYQAGASKEFKKSTFRKDTRYQQEQKEEKNGIEEKDEKEEKDESKIIQRKEVVRKKQWSYGTQLKIGRKFAVYNQNQNNLIEQMKQKKKRSRNLAWRQKYSLLKHVNINYQLCDNTSNTHQKIQQQEQPCIQYTKKLPSYDAFVAEMKIQQRLRKMTS